MRKFMDSSDPAADNLFGHFEVIGRLQVDPVLRRLAKDLAEKQGHLSGDRSFPFDDVGYSHGRKSNGTGKLSLRDPQFVKILFKKFTRMNRRKIVFRIHGFTSSVIINNFNIVSLTVFKPETDAPLFVDADAPLPGANSYQRFQAVRWRHTEIVNNRCCVDLRQPLYRPLQNVGRETSGFPGDIKTFGFSIRECSNHGNDYKLIVYDSQAEKPLAMMNDWEDPWHGSRAAQILRESMIDARQMYLKDVPVLIDVSFVDNWYKK